MSTNLHELTKQLDALTYNSRSVLNALIRSVMAAGSSTGWTVKRAGETLVMTRADIYLLSTFYTAWEYTRFDEAQFDIIRENLDTQFSGKEGLHGQTPVTYAIVQHSKIMTMTSDDSSVTDDEYWLAKVRGQVNPKLFTNTAPIPINIRTPIYDENLSTKHFDQFETYLFPRSYYTIDTLGYSGDNATHIGGGREWFFDVDDKMTIGADRTVIGVQNPETAAVRESNYQTLGTLSSIAGGTDSYAYGPNSLSIGDSNQVYGSNSAAIGGSRNYIYANSGGIIGGLLNTVTNDYGAIAGGEDNSITGDDGFAANERNNVGGYNFFFRRYITTPNAGTVTTCKDEIEEDGCLYTLASIGSAGKGSDAGGNIAPNQVLIDTDTLAASGFGSSRRRITSAYDGGEYGYADFKVGDFVRLTRPKGYDVSKEANMGQYLDRKITALEMRSYGLVITFDNSVNRFPGMEGEVYSGRIARRLAYQIPVCSNFGRFIEFENLNAAASTALGYNTIAGGRHQTVVGNSNLELLRPMFIVGNGSHYIDVGTYRHNAFVVAKNYSYLMTSSHYVNFGVSDYTTATNYVHGDLTYKENRKWDEDYQQYDIEKYQGIYAYDMDDEALDLTRAVLRVSHQKTVLGVGQSCVRMFPVSTKRNPNNIKVLAELMSHDGAVSIHAGSWQYGDDEEPFTIENDWETYYNTKVSRGGSDRSLTLWSVDEIGIHGSNGIGLHTTSYIHAEYGALTLSGHCLGALTADTSEPQGLMDFKMGSETNRLDLAFIKYPGHYYVDKKAAVVRRDTEESYPEYVGAYHVISNTHYVLRDNERVGNVYSTAQLILPGKVTCSSVEHYTLHLPHPKFQVTNVFFPDDIHSNPTNADENYICKELAYLDDVKQLESKTIGQFVGTPAVTRTVEKGVMSYAKMCEVKFGSLESAYAGATFSFTLRDDNSWSSQGFVCFSPCEHNINTVDGVSIITYERQGHSGSDPFDRSKVKVWIQPHPDRVSCTIWYSTDCETTFFKTFKLLAGDAEVDYYMHTTHTSISPTNATALPWKEMDTNS